MKKKTDPAGFDLEAFLAESEARLASCFVNVILIELRVRQLKTNSKHLNRDSELKEKVETKTGPTGVEHGQPNQN